jgi:hypothetical protein
MLFRPSLAAALLAAMASAASAQTPPDDSRVTLSPVNVGSTACVELVRLADKNPGLACAVSGIITPAGKVEDTAARCENPAFENTARRCFGRFTLEKEYAGQTGPVCAALLFVPIGRPAEALEISLREYTPCASLKRQN